MKKLWLILCAGVVFLLTGCDLDSFLFNVKPVDSYTLPGNTIPDSLVEAVTFSSDGNTLYGYWVKSDGARPGLALIYCEGNKHNLDNYWDRVMLMHQLGVNILIFDYRGYGRSEGESSETGLHHDAEAALAFVRAKGFSADSIVVMGYSLGNVPAIYITAEKITPRCLICESPFASANSLTQGSLGLDLPPLWLTTGKFDNADEIKKIRCPLLLIHGEDDDFVRWRDNGRVVFASAPEPKRLELVSKAKHDDIPKIMGEEDYIALLNEWITTLH